MKNGDADIEEMKAQYDARRRLLLASYEKLGLECFEPKGAFYSFPCIRSSGLTSEEFCDRLIREERVAVIPGTAFGPGGEGFVRACYAASLENIEEAMRRIGRFLDEVRAEKGLK